MNSVRHFIFRMIEFLVTSSGKVALVCALLLVPVTVTDVVLRYLLSAGSVAVQELEWHLFSAVFLLGAAYTLQQDQHVRVDILYSRLPTRGKALIDVLGTVFFLLPFCYVGLAVSIPFMLRSYATGEISADPGGLPFRYLPKGLIVVGFALLLLQGTALLLSSVAQLVSGVNGSSVPRTNPPITHTPTSSSPDNDERSR